MHWEALPNWCWVIYYIFLLITLGTAIFSVVKKKMKSLAILAIGFTVSVPMISLINSIGRTEGINELEHLFSQLQQGAMWSIFTIIGYLFLLVWWILFLIKNRTKTKL
ncbi:hypothetical protein [Priestia endophytica]|uniref:hypothetical protein n=1 Tax=Priestia endophytica TaxID=135735 RepID=UPI000DCA75E8|nr:hypothetical protein [Priestia endophytica]RAS77335.1 hypothetical protein A4R27_18800 [Priestia endophytica]